MDAEHLEDEHLVVLLEVDARGDDSRDEAFAAVRPAAAAPEAAAAIISPKRFRTASDKLQRLLPVRDRSRGARRRDQFQHTTDLIAIACGLNAARAAEDASRSETTCVGVAVSVTALLLAGGTTGKRAALPNAKILIHQLSAGFEGQATDIEIQAREIIKVTSSRSSESASKASAAFWL